MNANLEKLQAVLERVRREVHKVIIGQNDAVDQALIVIFTGHHALIEGVPGIAKTLLARTLARVLGCEFRAYPIHARPDAGRYYRDQRL